MRGGMKNEDSGADPESDQESFYIIQASLEYEIGT